MRNTIWYTMKLYIFQYCYRNIGLYTFAANLLIALLIVLLNFCRFVAGFFSVVIALPTIALLAIKERSKEY